MKFANDIVVIGRLNGIFAEAEILEIWTRKITDPHVQDEGDDPGL